MYQAQFASRTFYVPFPPYNRNNTDQLQRPTFLVAGDPGATGDHRWKLQLVTLAELTNSVSQFGWPGLSLSPEPQLLHHSPGFYSGLFLLLLQPESLTSSSRVPLSPSWKRSPVAGTFLPFACSDLVILPLLQPPLAELPPLLCRVWGPSTPSPFVFQVRQQQTLHSPSNTILPTR